MGLAAAISVWFDDGFNSGIGRVVVGETIDKFNQGGRFQKDETSGIEVVRQRAKWFRPEPDLGAAFPLGRRIECECAQRCCFAVSSRRRTCRR